MSLGSITIRQASTPAEVEEARLLFLEYADALPFALEFQNFYDELRDLPGEYKPPAGALFLAIEAGETAGCVALRPLEGETCELKRLFVRSEWRGRGLGRILTITAIERARSIGYKKIKLDTVPSMAEAIALYRSLGFRDTDPYRFNPVDGAMFFERDL
jgi:putative acetyltransferase